MSDPAIQASKQLKVCPTGDNQCSDNLKAREASASKNDNDNDDENNNDPTKQSSSPE